MESFVWTLGFWSHNFLPRVGSSPALSRTGVPAGDPQVLRAGFSHQALLDIQKLLACALVVGEAAGLTNKDNQWLKEVGACVAYSSRMTLAARQNPSLKSLSLDWVGLYDSCTMSNLNQGSKGHVIFSAPCVWIVEQTHGITFGLIVLANF